MGPDLELKGNGEANVEVSISKEAVTGPPFLEAKTLQPVTNYKDNAYGMEAPSVMQNSLSIEYRDVEINITGCTNSGKALTVEAASEDATECSSSFGDTGSCAENDSTFSDAEVDSQMCADNALLSCDGWCEPLLLRNKKLTIHWRDYIRPLMWRCKWVELQMRQLQSLARKYDRELAAYDNKKQLAFGNVTLDGLDTKSVPLSDEIGRDKIMKRKKRRRVEEKCDPMSYMANHNIFSYYENKKKSAGAPYLEDPSRVNMCDAGNNKELGLNDIWSCLEPKESDKSVEEIIKKIEALQSQVQKLKARIDKVVCENPGNCGDMTLLLDTTVRPEHEILWEDTKDGILINNQAASEELQDFENVRNQLLEKSKDAADEQQTNSQPQVSEPYLARKNAVPNVQSTLKVCSTSKSNSPMNTKKRKRRAASKKWGRR